MPHKCVTQRQDPHTGKCLDIQFCDIFLAGNSRVQTFAIKGRLPEHFTATGNGPSHWPKLSHVFCLDYFVVTTAVHCWVVPPSVMVQSDDGTCLYLQRTTRVWRTGLVDLNLLPSCVSVTAPLLLVLRVNFELMCNLSLWIHHADQPQKQSKPMVWSDAYKCCSFFCLLYKMCYFALSLLRNTFLKKQMWMFTVYGLVFFFLSATLQENNDLWAFWLR